MNLYSELNYFKIYWQIILEKEIEHCTLFDKKPPYCIHRNISSQVTINFFMGDLGVLSQERFGLYSST